jgi:adenylate cyclase
LEVEIERKFLVADETWRAACVRSERLVDGLLATSKGRKVRVRIYGDRATICIKSRKKGGRVRNEFEYEIPVGDARQLIENDCGGDVLVKMRHYVPYAGFTWEVDEYEAELAGVVIAEVELPSEDTEPRLPPWAGREVTDDPRYRKGRLRALRRVEKGAAAAPKRRRA